MQEEKKFYTAKYDRVFKSIICDGEDYRILKKVLASSLDIDVDIIEIKKCELPIGNVSERVKIVDLIVLINKKDIVHVELNLENNQTLRFRNFAYFSTVISVSTKKGKEYDRNINYIHIDFSYGRNLKQEKEEYFVQNKRGKKYVENVKIIEYDMDYVKKNCYNDPRYKYLAMLDMEIVELSNIAEGDEVVMDYMEKLKKINENSEFQSLMTQEESAQMMVNTYVREAKEEGKKEGAMEAKKEMILSLYKENVTIEKIAKAANMNEEEVKKIIKEN